MFRPFLSLATFGIAIVSSLATPVIPSGITLAEYTKLFELCKNGGSETYVAVRFGEDSYTTFNFNECYPYKIDGNVASQAVFCKASTCYNNPNEDCTGGAVPPVPITVPEGLTLVNAADWVHLLGQGALCHANILS